MSTSPSQPVLGSSFEERLQARLDAFEAAHSVSSTRPPPEPVVVDLDRPDGWPELDELNRQVKVLRNQLKEALEEVDRRLEVSATRIEQAERRAADASTRADAAIENLNRLALDARSGAPADQRERLREALTQLRTRSSTPG